MNREVQVRICERLGVKFPGPTRQTLPKWLIGATSAFPLESDRPTDIPDWQLRADIVAKVFLRAGTQILKAVGRAFEK
jgi:hypothetical protein